PGDRGRLAAREEPPARSRGQRYADHGQAEVEDRHVAEIAEVVVVHRRENGVGAGDAEQRAEEGERAGGGRRESSANGGGGSGRGQRPEVTGALASNQPDRHREDGEREEAAGR